MTTYKELFGKAVKYLSTDPTTEAEGQVWYNSTSGTFKSVVATAAWSSGAPLITARSYGGGGGSSQLAAWYAGGYVTAAVANTEEYNGSGWSASNNINTTRYRIDGTGTLAAGLIAGGVVPSPAVSAATEEYDGTSWATSPGSLNTARGYGATTGIQTAALMFGGNTNTADPPASNTGATEEYNGTSWTSNPTSMNDPRKYVTGVGTQTATIGFAGTTIPGTNPGAAEEYNGSTWTTVSTTNSGSFGRAGFGIQTSAIAAGGIGIGTTTEKYDGTTWTVSSATLGTPMSDGGDAGNTPSSAGVIFGGRLGSSPYGNTAVTEEYNFSASVITAAAWASGGNMNTTRRGLTSVGTQDSAVAFGGINTSPPFLSTTATESYDGSAWTSVAGMNTERRASGGAGNQTAGLAFGGFSNPIPGGTTATESWNGSAWTTEPGTMASPARSNYFGSCGIQTAALACGATSATEEYDGTSWTTSNPLNTARGGNSSVGLLTAALAFGGEVPGPTGSTEEYDGTSWTAANPLITSRHILGGAGTQTLALAFGGEPIQGKNEGYDGTNWSTRTSMTTARRLLGGCGTQTLALASGGGTPSDTNATEEWTGETSANNYKTLTTS